MNQQLPIQELPPDSGINAANENRAPTIKEQLETARAEITHLQQQLSLLRQENEQLRTLSETDPLTGLYNRRHLNQKMEEYFKSIITPLRQRRNKRTTTLSIILIDLNGLKNINDTKGHQAGDQAIVNTVKTLKECLRDCTISRTGGDEFCILLPDVTQKNAEKIACRIAQELKKQDLFAGFGIGTLSQKTLKIYNAANNQSSGNLTPDMFLHTIDRQALYASKEKKDSYIAKQRAATPSQLPLQESFITSLAILNGTLKPLDVMYEYRPSTPAKKARFTNLQTPVR